MRKNLDSEIWRRFKKGDEEAFAYIFDTYHLQLVEYGQRFTSDIDLLRDSIQDVFFELARKRNNLSAVDNILFYLLKSVRNQIFGNLKKSKKVCADSNDGVFEEFHLMYNTDADPLEKELKLDQLADALNQLPARQKETIYLKFYKNFSNAQVAEVMGVNYQTVGNNVQKAIAKLKNLLEADTDSVILFIQTFIR